MFMQVALLISESTEDIIFILKKGGSWTMSE